MPILKMYRCKDCRHEFSDLPPNAQLFEMGDVNPGSGALDNKKPVPQACPDCDSSSVEPIIEKGMHKDA